MYRFRLNTPTIAVRYGKDGRQAAVIIPDGAEIATDDLDVLRNGGDGARLVTALWNGTTIGIFLVDLQERGELTEQAGT